MSFLRLPSSDRGAIVRLEGAAALDYGQRLFSRDIKKLAINEGALALFLSAEARVLEVFWVIRRPDALWLIAKADRQESLMNLIEKYHFAEPFQTLRGPVVKTSLRPVAALGETGRGKYDEATGMFRGEFRELEFIFEEHPDAADELAPAEMSLWNEMRISHLIPARGIDYDEQTLVFDLGFDELCDANKGCYIGQEIVERVRSRGSRVQKRIALLEFEDEPPAPGVSIVNAAEEPCGAIGESRCRNALGTWYSLAWMKPGAGALGTEVFVKSASGNASRPAKFLRISAPQQV